MFTDERHYSEREVDLGVPAVEELLGLPTDQRAQKTAETVLYLAGCTVGDAIEAANRVIGLYSRAALHNSSFGVAEVDVYAKAAVQVLTGISSDEAAQAAASINNNRRVVGAQKGKSLLPLG